jgi:hypothetical protein
MFLNYIIIISDEFKGGDDGLLWPTWGSLKNYGLRAKKQYQIVANWWGFSLEYDERATAVGRYWEADQIRAADQLAS